MTPSQPSGGTILGNPTSVVVTFDKAYWASQPLPVQALQNMTYAQRLAAMGTLIAQGFFIDYVIMIEGADAYGTMANRQADGYTEYPDATGTMTRPVDLNPADYTPVAVPPDIPAGSLVGPQIGNSNFYFMTPLAVQQNLPSGFVTTQNGQQFILVYTTQMNPIGGGIEQIGRWIAITPNS